MINVCTWCLRLNPFGPDECGYCQGELLEMESGEYPQFRLKQLEIFQKEEKKFQLELKGYPDLKVFEDCRTMSNQAEIVLLRP
jgi:hypothetical protein